jgi:hypothetical protein
MEMLLVDASACCCSCYLPMLIQNTAQGPQHLRSVKGNYIHRNVLTVLIGRLHAVASLTHYLTFSGPSNFLLHRTGKRDLGGLLNDGINSLARLLMILSSFFPSAYF